MRLINRLTPPGEIRSVRLDEDMVRVRLVDDKILVYRRIEDVSVKGQESLRRSPLYQGL